MHNSGRFSHLCVGRVLNVVARLSSQVKKRKLKTGTQIKGADSERATEQDVSFGYARKCHKRPEKHKHVKIKDI